jgi:hypothetical protein
VVVDIFGRGAAHYCKWNQRGLGPSSGPIRNAPAGSRRSTRRSVAQTTTGVLQSVTAAGRRHGNEEDG